MKGFATLSDKPWSGAIVEIAFKKDWYRRREGGIY